MVAPANVGRRTAATTRAHRLPQRLDYNLVPAPLGKLACVHSAVCLTTHPRQIYLFRR